MTGVYDNERSYEDLDEMFFVSDQKAANGSTETDPTSSTYSNHPSTDASVEQRGDSSTYELDQEERDLYNEERELIELAQKLNLTVQNYDAAVEEQGDLPSYEEDENIENEKNELVQLAQKLNLTVQNYDELEEVMNEYYVEKETNKVHNRLYERGMALAERRALAAKMKKDADEYVEEPKLELATRSYKGNRLQYSVGDNAHERLYNNAAWKKKQAIEEEAMMDVHHMSTTAPKTSLTNAVKSSSRLYGRSKTKQEEGKRLRNEIAKKLNRPAPKPSKKISISDAQNIYQRGIMFKSNSKKKIEAVINAPRESKFPKMRTLTPNRRDQFRDVQSSGYARVSRSDSNLSRRSETPSRRRSETPSRTCYATPSSGRATSTNRTSSRSAGRSQTPTQSRYANTPSKVRMYIRGESPTQDIPSRGRDSVRSGVRTRSQTPSHRRSESSTKPRAPSRNRYADTPSRVRMYIKSSSTSSRPGTPGSLKSASSRKTQQEKIPPKTPPLPPRQPSLD
ncbi:predicted protein [Chaetoceros tenuissimus]|uniref:Uncharacterized protein n=1 Tax=Chaetoceros tenuissimus TaxID=426638 RepID=A0AAD3H3L0_9STRA|nr:predicted protein [Chaetoceros tenuissimus]